MKIEVQEKKIKKVVPMDETLKVVFHEDIKHITESQKKENYLVKYLDLVAYCVLPIFYFVFTAFYIALSAFQHE